MAIKNLYTGEREFLDYQKCFGFNESVVKDFVEYDAPEIGYSMGSIRIGTIKNSNKAFSLNLSQSKRMLILGSTGSGKSVLQNCIMDRFIKSGGVVTVADLKGEYIYKKDPLQDKFAKKVVVDENGKESPKYLFKGEKPQGFDVSAYYPIFLQNLRKSMYSKEKKLIENEKLCQLRIQNLTKNDFQTFFDHLTSNNPTYFDVLDEIWNEIVENDLYTWDEIVDSVNENQNLTAINKRQVLRTIITLKENEILGDAFDEPDLVSDINNRKLGVIDLQGLLNLPSSVSPALVYVNILLRRIYNSKVQGVINKSIHNMIVVDEVNKFAPKLGETPSKREFLKLLDLVRSEHISMLYSTQDYKRIPETLMTQADYIFLPYNVALEDIAEIVRTLLPQEYGSPHTFKSKMGFIQSMMKLYPDGKRDWLCINRIEKSRKFFVPVLPLSRFIQEGENV